MLVSRTSAVPLAPVSTSGHTLDAQLDQVRAYGCDLIFQETISGARAADRLISKAASYEAARQLLEEMEARDIAPTIRTFGHLRAKVDSLSI